MHKMEITPSAPPPPYREEWLEMYHRAPSAPSSAVLIPSLQPEMVNPGGDHYIIELTSPDCRGLNGYRTRGAGHRNYTPHTSSSTRNEQSHLFQNPQPGPAFENYANYSEKMALATEQANDEDAEDYRPPGRPWGSCSNASSERIHHCNHVGTPRSGSGRSLQTERNMHIKQCFILEDMKRVNWVRPKHFKKNTILTDKGELLKPDLLLSSPPGKCTQKHVCIFLVSVLSHGGFLASLATVLSRVSTGRFPGGIDLTGLLAIVFMVLCYIFSLLEAYVSDTATYLQNLKTPEEMEEFLEELVKCQPRISWKVQCVHYEANNPRRSYVTHTASRKYTSYKDLWNISGSTEDLPTDKIVRIEFEKIIGFLDDRSLKDYKNSMKKFHELYATRDDAFTHQETIDLPGYNSRVMLFNGDPDKRGILHVRYFIIASLFLLGWVYRWWLRSRSAKQKYTFVKLIGPGTENSPRRMN